ncbi:plasmanylethanolamine desaturase 1-like isoform X1 [Clavelina lepadiformis]|uniref:plasmanylethanolamine desaturase 1-like isoform X1 n=1 Tax=Clavelina lepadiformis TaxID=159417 RepID=UPI0040426E74
MIMKTTSQVVESEAETKERTKYGKVTKDVRPHTSDMWLRELILALTSALMLLVNLIFLIRHFKTSYSAYVLPCFFLGLLTADFQSAFIHWVVDTYFSSETPILGPAIVRPFRLHHFAPTQITYNDYLRTYGDAAVFTTPHLLFTMWILCFYSLESKFVYFLVLWIFSYSLVGYGVNQFHQWAHTHGRPIPAAAEFLQKLGLILPKDHHRKHHTPPHDCNYCIVAGLVDGPLEAINFWRRLENVVESVTGVKPRIHTTVKT